MELMAKSSSPYPIKNSKDGSKYLKMSTSCYASEVEGPKSPKTLTNPAENT
jgi:hypothetical protein